MPFPSSIGVSLLPITVKMRSSANFDIEAKATALALASLEQFRDAVRQYPPEVSGAGFSFGKGRMSGKRVVGSVRITSMGQSRSSAITESDKYRRTQTLYNAWKIEQQLTSANITLRLYNDAVESGANRRDRGRPYAFFVHGTTQRYGAAFHRANGWKQIKDLWPPYRQTFTKYDIRPLIQVMIDGLAVVGD